jgi:uncharacterized cupredoxin-like copper-binding protein
MDDDSDVKLHGSSDEVALGGSDNMTVADSNVRLEKIGLPLDDSSEGNMHLTEEINLDEEIQKQQALLKDQPSTKMKAKSELRLPTGSPFELSDSDLELPSELKKHAGPKTPKVAKSSEHDSSDFDLAAQTANDEGSSDFDLVPSSDGSILLEASGNTDFSLDPGDSEQVFDHGQAGELTSSSSGISLNNPIDAGISLEEGSDAGDFDLSLEAEDTPKPQKASPIDDSDSNFDLSLDADADAEPKAESSEFELNLEGSGEVATSESDSEFELTLDDSGQVEEEKPQVKAKPKAKSRTKMKPASAEEQDIFDTDFEVPALEESDDAGIADSELESSDFDLALDDSELAQEEESGSQVVALDEDSEATVEEDAAVVDDIDVEDESSDFSALDEDVEVGDDDAVDVDADEETATSGTTRTVVKEKLIPAAPWGILPTVFMLPCVLIMFLVGILGYELVQTSAGLKPPGPLTQALAEQFGTPVSLKK